MFPWFRNRRRKRICAQPFPSDWLAIVEANLSYYPNLAAEERGRLVRLVQVFLAEKHFEGCGGQVIDDEIRVTVAAHACLLLLGIEHDYYPGLSSILVYPGAFVVKTTERGPGALRIHDEDVLDGQAWSRGVVILAWDGVLKGLANGHDGYNVAYHEFAHQLDMENGEADGYPVIYDRQLRRDWSDVCTLEYNRLIREVERGRRTLLCDYGATDPAEFFAVATEVFFERPGPMKRRHPKLYDIFARYYGQDPAPR